MRPKGALLGEASHFAARSADAGDIVAEVRRLTTNFVLLRVCVRLTRARALTRSFVLQVFPRRHIS